MRVLVGCEESQAITKAFRARGHEAYSCDIKDCSGGHPEWHLKGDFLDVVRHPENYMSVEREGIEWDMVICHPPCFVADTKVMTFDGIKSIQDIKIGDMVLTHTGTYKRVLDVMQKDVLNIVEVFTENCGRIECTANHPFYVKEVVNKIEHRKHFKVLSDFMWKNPTEFVTESRGYRRGNIKKTYLTSVVDSIKEIPQYNGAEIGINAYATKRCKTLKIEDTNLWYIIGRWIGDGWFYYQYYKQNKRLAGIKICCSKEETAFLKSKIEQAGFTYYLHQERTTNKFEIANKELGLYLEQFGKGAENKFIPGFVTRLTDELALSFLEGYFDADGSTRNTGVMFFSTVSKNLAYGIKYMINKYYKVGCSIRSEQNRNIIEGRVCKVKQIYSGTFNRERRKQTRYINYENYILAPYREVNPLNKITTVYNLSVEDDESYTANGIVVHNCTDLAVSGARHFEKKRADGRQRESIEFFCKCLTLDVPKLCVENPVNIISGEYIKEYFPDLCKKYGLPIKPTQIIQPYEYGNPSRKATCLWLKGLPNLVPTNIVEPELITYTCKNGKKVTFSKDYAQASGDRGTVRSKTYNGIAQAMADQWGNGVYPKPKRKGLLKIRV